MNYDLYDEVVDRRSVFGRAIMEIMGDKGGEIMDAKNFDKHNVEIKMTINGVEVNAKEAIEEMMKIRSNHINALALDLLTEKFDGLVGEVWNLKERLEALYPWNEI